MNTFFMSLVELSNQSEFEVTTQAFDLLGEQGIIRAADQHACSECTQPYKKASDAVMDDPAAVVGVDENQDVPPLAEDNRVSPQPLPASPISQGNSDNAMDVDKRNVTMVVLDGVVMGPTVNYLNFILSIIITNLIFIALYN